MFLIVNDKSINCNGDNTLCKQIIEKFIKTFAQLTSEYGDKINKSLISTVSLNDIMLNDKYGFKIWRNQNVDKDLKSKFLSMCDRENIITIDTNADFEISIGNYRDGALLEAYNNEYALLSFATSETWEKSFLKIRVDYVDDRPFENDDLKNFYNLLTSEDIDWINNLPSYDFIKNYPTPQILLENLQDVFPHLFFHDKAQKQLAKEVQQGCYAALLGKLLQLNSVCEKMIDGNLDISCFAPRTLSHESRETLKQYGEKHYSFTYNGKEYNVEYHLRYTGNVAGRIYFARTNSDKCIIYSLTSKLPTVSEPKSFV